MNELREAALMYARARLPIIPCDARGKRPLTPHGVNDASTNPSVITGWWDAWPQANLAIALTRNLVVVDVDVWGEFDRFLRSRSLFLPPTASVRTGKGRHLYFCLPPSVTAPNLVRCFPGADLRSFGGYVLAPPSIHPSGARYTWETPFEALSSAPSFLIEALTSQQYAPRSTTPLDSWLTLVAGGVREGGRNDAITRLAGKLLRHLPPQLVLELVLAFNDARCQPPLSSQEVTRTVNSIASRETRHRQKGITR
jgi:hypothetical protein